MAAHIDLQAPTYPEFGTPIGNPLKKQPYQHALKALDITVKVVAAAALISLAAVTIAGVIHPAFLAIPLAVASVFVVYQAAKFIYNYVQKHRFDYDIGQHANNSSAPKLGTFIPTDVVPLNRVEEIFEMKKEILRTAEKSIEVSFNFAGGEEFREVLKIIEDRMAACPKLKVHLLLSQDLLESEDFDCLKKLHELKPQSFEYLITDRVYRRTPNLMSEENHVKVLIVDEKYFVLGGSGITKIMTREKPVEGEVLRGNLATKALGNSMKDADIAGRGDLAKTMRNQFFNLYHVWEHRMQGKASHRYFDAGLIDTTEGNCNFFENHANKCNGAKTKFIVAGPEHRQDNPIVKELTSEIEKAETKVKIANLLFIPSKPLKKAIRAAKDRGVKTVGYLNGRGTKLSHSGFLFTLFNRPDYGLFSKVREQKINDRMYHKKLTVIDKKTTILGSFNIGVKSSQSDYESVVVVDDPRVANVFNQGLKEDRLDADTFKEDDLKMRPNRLIGPFVKHLLARFVG